MLRLLWVSNCTQNVNGKCAILTRNERETEKFNSRFPPARNQLTVQIGKYLIISSDGYFQTVRITIPSLAESWIKTQLYLSKKFIIYNFDINCIYVGT